MTLLEKIRQFYKSGILGDEDTNKCAEHLGKLFECDVFILNDKGGFWGVYHRKPIACKIIREMLARGVMDVSCMARINALTDGNISSSCFNPYCAFNSKKGCSFQWATSYEIPAIAFDQRIGTVVFAREKKKFTNEEKAVLEMIVMTMAFEGLYWIERRKNIQDEKKIQLMNFNASLSATERQALDAVIQEMNGQTEKRIVASKVAEKSGIARSIIVNALKKMSGAGLAEVISMGAAGTYVKVDEALILS